MRKKRFMTVLVLMMMLASVFSSSAVFAAMPPDDTVDPQTIMRCSRSFIASSSTKAKATVSATSSGQPEYITSKITLQSAPAGTTSYSNVSGVDPEIRTVQDQGSILHQCTFPITSDKEYRIKIELTDKVNGTVTTKTYYEELS